MADNLGFTPAYGLPFPVPGDVDKAVLVSDAIKRIDALLNSFYSQQTGPIFLYDDGSPIIFDDGSEVSL